MNDELYLNKSVGRTSFDRGFLRSTRVPFLPKERDWRVRINSDVSTILALFLFFLLIPPYLLSVGKDLPIPVLF